MLTDRQDMVKTYDAYKAKGFINKDESIDYNKLKAKTKALNNFSELSNDQIELHPQTFVIANKSKNIVAYEGEMELVLTEELLTNPRSI